MYFSIGILPRDESRLVAEPFGYEGTYGITMKDSLDSESPSGDARIHFKTREDAIAVIEAARAELLRMDADALDKKHHEAADEERAEPHDCAWAIKNNRHIEGNCDNPNCPVEPHTPPFGMPEKGDQAFEEYSARFPVQDTGRD